MSVITLQFGQCGNQLGNCLYSTVTQDLNARSLQKDNAYYNQIVNKWFNINKHGKWEPRSILIDTECKVIQSMEPLPYNFKNVIAKSFGGSANNWACGYTRNGKRLANEVMNVIRTETEKCDFLSSFLNLYSSSGGTGSGVGSFLIQQLRDDYPNKHIVNSVVLPYIKGEIVTQSYNSLLTLAHLYSLADSTILFENERLHYTCKYALDADDVHFSHMNMIISQQLAALYQPLNSDVTSVLNDLTSHPLLKFLQTRSEPYFSKQSMKFECSKTWKTLMTSISKQSRFDYTYQKQTKSRNRTICRAVVARGLDRPTESDVKPVDQIESGVSWLSRENFFKVYHQAQNFLNFDKYVVVVSNSNSVCVPLNFLIEDAWNLFNHGAYLHHYKKYGIDEEFFLNSFQTLENILDAYKCV